MTEQSFILTPNAEKLLKFWQVNDSVWVGKDLIEATGIKGVNRVIGFLVKYNLVEPVEPVTREFTTSKGIVITKDYKAYSLTDAGRAYKF